MGYSSNILIHGLFQWIKFIESIFSSTAGSGTENFHGYTINVFLWVGPKLWVISISGEESTRRGGSDMSKGKDVGKPGAQMGLVKVSEWL